MDKPVVGSIVFGPKPNYKTPTYDTFESLVAGHNAAKKPHHKPMPLERNGFSTIVMHVDAVRRGAVLDLDLIERTARVGIRYIDALSAGQLPRWTDLTACVVCGGREYKQDVNSLCDLCNAKNKVAGDHE